MSPQENLSGKTAVVTGGARGIGRAIAMELGRQGARVIITYRSEELLANAVAGDLRNIGADSSTVRVDVRNTDDLEQLFQEVRQAHGGVDILVNNAGVTDDGLVMRMTDESWTKVVDTNLTGTFHATRLALRQMTRARWGRVINSYCLEKRRATAFSWASSRAASSRRSSSSSSKSSLVSCSSGMRFS